MNKYNIKSLKINKWNKVDKIKVLPLPSIHNSVNPVVYVIKYKKRKVVYFTDSEYFESKHFKNAHIYLIEANYNNELKISKTQKAKHITKVVNHLTLEQAEELFHKYKGPKTKFIQFIHLSSSTKDYYLLDKLINSNNDIKYHYVKVNEFNKNITINI